MLRLGLSLLAALALPGSTGGSPDARARMIAEVQSMAAASRAGRIAPAVLAALRAVPRHRFVPAWLRMRAYANEPLPIGNGQTISQPFIVAWMTDLLEPEKDDVVLEVGTGSGYQAAVLSGLVARVYSIEIVEPLARQAAKRLTALGYANVTVRHGDGYAGWPAHAPFDGIIVTAGAARIPAPLVRQLKPGGRMVIPVGPHGATQQLVLIRKSADGKISRRSLGGVRFVPLTRDGDRR